MKLVLFLLIITGNVLAIEYKEVKWHELVPANYDEKKEFKKINWDDIEEDDWEMQKKIQSILDKAPSDAKWNGKVIQIAGYIAPLNYNGEKKLKEFFIVPYFGACIHSPPPPANQIIYVKVDKGVSSKLYEDAVRVYGTINVSNTNTDIGTSGYTLKLDKIERDY